MFYWVLNNADEIAPSTLSAQKKYSAHSNPQNGDVQLFKHSHSM
ncbi:hypothetical protein AtDm6_2848 [Acetobacter tropicalis]|uniref:Uncharacterized protein n=1 Tax=Acetobacter tropicalis TaxID=104102 RepID=A0A094YIP6_9PROT|nr:hypothetical protein AtDm6_2848 [Acetobacter tropicalis]